MAEVAAAPQLQPPGAGLPQPELFIARCLFFWEARTTNRRRTVARFARARDAILALAGTCPSDEGSRQVLIRRLPGIEDSSRYWSVFMTVEHLRIVNAATAETIRLLGRNQVPSFVASTAAVKPRDGVGAEVIAKFTVGCAELAQSAAELKNLRTARRFAHPWFGPLDAADWHFLAAFHMGLHLQQMERIKQNLREVEKVRPVDRG